MDVVIYGGTSAAIASAVQVKEWVRQFWSFLRIPILEGYQAVGLVGRIAAKNKQLVELPESFIIAFGGTIRERMPGIGKKIMAIVGKVPLLLMET